MSADATQQKTFLNTIPDWEPPLPPTDLIFDDGEPLESNRHRIAMNALIRLMLVAQSGQTDYFTSGNMFIYYSSEQVRNRDFRGPDFFVVLNVDGTQERLGWVVWEENGRYPDVIVELMSPSTAAVDLGVKKDIYEQIFRTPDYFVFDPFDPNSLQGWHLDANQQYQLLTPNGQGRLWCQRLQLWLGTWKGEIEGKPAIWLRFFDSEGNLIPLPEEAAEQARQQEAQARKQAEQAQRDAIPRLLAMGLTMEQVAEALGLSVDEINRNVP
ncbi:MAG: Uma2 family endonuclease [Coleofasciculus sp. G1-WW12-02]|uniref:Uma2 family endonuclease n=1 Tax=unclassified Coleofasciculus TaxID=2692782 RepID=UPI0032F45C43